MTTDISIGDVVQLNSGGAEMTVTEVRSDGELTLVWTDNAGVPNSISVASMCVFSL